MSDIAFSIAAAASVLAQGASATIEPIAISCVGSTQETTYLDNGEAETVTRPQTRIYIIDEERGDVAIYHQDFETPSYICSDAKVRCTFEFYPAMVFLRKQTVGFESHSMMISRKTGEVFDMSTNEFGSVTFDGACTKTEIPIFDRSQNAF